MTEYKELQEEETRDVGQAVVSPGNRNARAVVSVAFARNDFERVAEAAFQGGMKTSEFIRNAALDAAKPVVQVTSLGLAGISLAGTITDAPSISGSTSAEAKPTVTQDIEFALSS